MFACLQVCHSGEALLGPSVASLLDVGPGNAGGHVEGLLVIDGHVNDQRLAGLIRIGGPADNVCLAFGADGSVDVTEWVVAGRSCGAGRAEARDERAGGGYCDTG